MMKVYKNEDVENVNLFESALVGISFNHHATVIEFKVSWLEGYEDEVIDVICNNCSDIDFAFKHEGDQLGELTITVFSYLKKDDASYWIQFDFDFTPKGYIRLLCSEFLFKVPSSPLQPGGNGHRIPWDAMKKEDPLDY